MQLYSKTDASVSKAKEGVKVHSSRYAQDSKYDQIQNSPTGRDIHRGRYSAQIFLLLKIQK